MRRTVSVFAACCVDSLPPSDRNQSVIDMHGSLAKTMRVRLAIGVLLFVLGATIAAQETSSDRTVWAGVYTAEQATRGSATFENNCAECHMSDLSGRAGPPLKGNDFMEHWRGKTVAMLFDKIKMTMPADWRTQLNESRTLDVVAYLLQKNGFPAGTQPLTVDGAAALYIKEGIEKADRPNH